MFEEVKKNKKVFPKWGLQIAPEKRMQSGDSVKHLGYKTSLE